MHISNFHSVSIHETLNDDGTTWTQFYAVYQGLVGARRVGTHPIGTPHEWLRRLYPGLGHIPRHPCNHPDDLV